MNDQPRTHSPRSLVKHTALGAIACASLLILTTTQAMALDGYQDRRGLFSGLSLGGGVGATVVDEDEGANTPSTGLDNGRKLGLSLSAIAGGGITQDLTAGAEISWWLRTVELNNLDLSHHHLSFNAVGQYFLIDGFFVQGGGGLAYAIFDAQNDGMNIQRYQELGLALKGGAGFEFFVSSQIAVGLNAHYTRHFYTNAEFDTIAAGATVRWY